MTAFNNNTVKTSQGTIIDLAIATEQDAMAVVEAFRTSQSEQSGADQAKSIALKTATRGNLYKNLGAFYGVAEKLLDPANVPFLVDILGKHGLRPADAGRNPFGPLTALLFGEWHEVEYKDNKGKTKRRKAPKTATFIRKSGGREQSYFVPNRSAEKYAKVARYARSQGWKPGEVAANMLSFKGGMAGILKADTVGTQGTDKDATDTAELVQLVFDQKPYNVLEFDQCGIGPQEEDRSLVGLWAEIKDDQVLIRGVLPMSDEAIHSFVARYAREHAAKLWKQKAKQPSEATV